MESRKCSLAKSLVYRAAVTVLLAALTWFYTGSVFQTSAITVIYSILATAAYYVLERVWPRIR